MKHLIVNADDFGMTEGINRGILESHHNGIVTSATLLANGEAFTAAARLSRDAPQLGVGVHLNLSQGLPVARPTGGRSTLVNRQGHLYLTPGKLFFAIAGRRVLLADVEGELRAQVRKVLDAGIAATHLDGHMHIHVLPGVSEIVVQIARESGIPAIRCPMERVGNPLWPIPHAAQDRTTSAPEAPPSRKSAIKRRLIALGVSTAARRLRWIARRAGLAYPARFYGVAETGILDRTTLQEILRSIPQNATANDGTAELMCHPGYVDANLARAGGELQSARQIEIEALTSPGIIEGVKRSGIALINYADLMRKSAH